MRVAFIIGIVAVLFGSYLCLEEGNKRKYLNADDGYNRQIDRLDEILSLGVFTTRQLIPPEDILALIQLIIEILDALEPLIPTEPTDPTATAAPTVPCK